MEQRKGVRKEEQHRELLQADPNNHSPSHCAVHGASGGGALESMAVKFSFEMGEEEALFKCLHLFFHHTTLLLIGNELNQISPRRVCSAHDSNW